MKHLYVQVNITHECIRYQKAIRWCRIIFVRVVRLCKQQERSPRRHHIQHVPTAPPCDITIQAWDAKDYTDAMWRLFMPYTGDIHQLDCSNNSSTIRHEAFLILHVQLSWTYKKLGTGFCWASSGFRCVWLGCSTNSKNMIKYSVCLTMQTSPILFPFGHT